LYIARFIPPAYPLVATAAKGRAQNFRRVSGMRALRRATGEKKRRARSGTTVPVVRL
jgi:hypothetical protein